MLIKAMVDKKIFMVKRIVAPGYLSRNIFLVVLSNPIDCDE